jgi:hypothetical protein
LGYRIEKPRALAEFNRRSGLDLGRYHLVFVENGEKIPSRRGWRLEDVHELLQNKKMARDEGRPRRQNMPPWWERLPDLLRSEREHQRRLQHHREHQHQR